DVGRRFLQRLQQGVERRGREHVDFVNDVDLVPRPTRPELHVLADVAYLVDAAVAGPVDFQDVHVFAGGDALADLAAVAGRRRGPTDAVEGLGQDAGGGGLTHAPGPREEVGVGHAVAGQGIHQGLGGGLLADEIAELLGAVATGQDRVLGGGTRRGL